MKIIVGSRGSSLALKQTEYVIEKLQRAYPENEYEIKVIHTIGDKMQHIALDKIKMCIRDRSKTGLDKKRRLALS